MKDLYYKLDLERSTLTINSGRVGRWYKVPAPEDVPEGFNADVVLDLVRRAVGREVSEGRMEGKCQVELAVRSPFTMLPLNVKVSVSDHTVDIEVGHDECIMTVPAGYSLIGVVADPNSTYRDLQVYISKVPFCCQHEMLVEDTKLYGNGGTLGLDSPLIMRGVVRGMLAKHNIAVARNLTASVINAGYVKRYELSLDENATDTPYITIESTGPVTVATISTIPNRSGWMVETPKGPVSVDNRGQTITSRGGYPSSEAIAWAVAAQETLQRFQRPEIGAVEIKFDKSMSGHGLATVGLHKPAEDVCPTLNYMHNNNGVLDRIVITDQAISEDYRRLKLPEGIDEYTEWQRQGFSKYDFSVEGEVDEGAMPLVISAIRQITIDGDCQMPSCVDITFTDKVLGMELNGRVERLPGPLNTAEDVSKEATAIDYSQMTDLEITERLEAILFSGLGDKASDIIFGREWLNFDHATSPVDKLMKAMLVAHLGSEKRMSALFVIAALDSTIEALRKVVRVMDTGVQSRVDIQVILDFFGLEWVDVDISVQLKK